MVLVREGAVEGPDADSGGTRDRENLAMTYEFIGRRQEAVDPQAALAAYRRSLQIAEGKPGEPSSPGLQAQILTDWRAISAVLAAFGDRAGALSAADKSIALAQGYGGSRMGSEVAKGQVARSRVEEIMARR